MRRSSLYQNLLASSLFAAAIGCGGIHEQESFREKAQGYFQYVEKEGTNYLSFRIENGNCYLQVSSQKEDFSMTDLECNGTVDQLNTNGNLVYRVAGDVQFIIADSIYAKYKTKVEEAVGKDLAEILRSL